VSVSVLLNTQYTLTSPTFVGADGETPEDCDTEPTCTVTRADGTALTAAVVTDAAGAGLYEAAITTDHTDQLDRLTITWTGTAGDLVQVYRQELEVAGGWYVTIPEAQNEPDLANTPIAEIRRERDRFEALAEDHCSVAFVPRYHRESLYGGCSHLMLKWCRPISILAVTIDDEAQDVDDFELDPILGLRYVTGQRFATGTGRNVVVSYTHGYQFPPADLKEACLAFIRSKVTAKKTGVPNAAMDGSDSTRQWTFGTPGTDKPTGIDSVDEVLNRYNETIPGIG
jgi:hypothetical protein